ncbi:(2Fe-2S)-binding protein [Elusimicrobiota bacterium]
MIKTTINLKVNDQTYSIDVEPSDTLLEALRDKIGVKSPKMGCDRGDCGSCTVILDNKTVRSCLVLAIETDGSSIITVEGLQKDKLTPLQKEFIKNNSFQCGYCAPGMVLSATELLGKNKDPDEDDVKEALSGNLCRCTGYKPIIDAVMEAKKSCLK